MAICQIQLFTFACLGPYFIYRVRITSMVLRKFGEIVKNVSRKIQQKEYFCFLSIAWNICLHLPRWDLTVSACPIQKKDFIIVLLHTWNTDYPVNTNDQGLLGLKGQGFFKRKDLSLLHLLVFATWLSDLRLYHSCSRSLPAPKNLDGKKSTSALCGPNFLFLSCFSSHCFHKHSSILGLNIRFTRDYLQLNH